MTNVMPSSAAGAKRVVRQDEVSDPRVSEVRVFEGVRGNNWQGASVCVLRPRGVEWLEPLARCEPRQDADGWWRCEAPSGLSASVRYTYLLVRQVAVQDRAGHETPTAEPDVYALLPEECLTLDEAPGAYYVSMQEGMPDGEKARLLSGPFTAHLAAWSAVSTVRDFLAQEGPAEAVWWRLGTARREPDEADGAPGPLNAAIEAWQRKQAAGRAAIEEEARAAAARPAAYFVVDDVIDEAGREGFELLYGDALTATGTRVHSAKTLSECLARVPAGDPVYRVKLARRHGEFSCRLIRGSGPGVAEPTEGPSP